eukprot:jgi/Botrbrau1/5098/Bobra.0128s0009.1
MPIDHAMDQIYIRGRGDMDPMVALSYMEGLALSAIDDMVNSVKGMLDALAKVKAGAGAIKRATWQRRCLAEQLQNVQCAVALTKEEFQVNHFPAKPEVRAGLKELKLQVKKVEDEVQELQDLIPGLTADMERTDRGYPTMTEKIMLALGHPGWVKSLSKAIEKRWIAYDVDVPYDHFVYRETFCERHSRLYIRPKGLYAKVVDQLRMAPDGCTRGVLIWGDRGMGTSSLAQDVAQAFAFEPDLSDCFPDGVVKVFCTYGDSTIESIQWALLNEFQGRENDDRAWPGRREILELMLRERRCLIWLDAVKDPQVVDACFPDGFAGALLLTSTRDNAKGTKLQDCLSLQITSDLFWTAPEDSGDRIASKILAANVANHVNMGTFPPGCEVVDQELVELCKGSILALVDVGSSLRGKTTPQEWERVKESLRRGILDGHELREDLPQLQFEAFDQALSGLSSEEGKIVLALWQFRPWAALPLPLVKLAVQVETGRDPATLEVSLEKLLKANLLKQMRRHPMAQRATGCQERWACG